MQQALGVSRQTAQRYLTALVADGVLSCHAIGRANYYVNTELYELRLNIPALK